jgi:predicted metal-binding membrane protein
MLAGLLRHDRVIVVAALFAVIFISWAYLLTGAGMDMPAMGGMLMPMASPDWTPSYFALTLAMWATMMAAMMLPSAAPMLLLYEKIARKRGETGETIGSTGLFGVGYVAVWAGFSVAAAALQYGLDKANLLSPMMATTSVALAGALLVAAGLYQWTPLKQTCLRHCRSPLEFIMTEWRGGQRGALAMGLRHGAFCLGCCWMLMLLLFVGGVMSFVWIAGIAAFVLVEKTAPAGYWLGRIVGTALFAWGGATLFTLLV